MQILIFLLIESDALFALYHTVEHRLVALGLYISSCASLLTWKAGKMIISSRLTDNPNISNAVHNIQLVLKARLNSSYYCGEVPKIGQIPWLALVTMSYK